MNTAVKIQSAREVATGALRSSRSVLDRKARLYDLARERITLHVPSCILFPYRDLVFLIITRVDYRVMT